MYTPLWHLIKLANLERGNDPGKADKLSKVCLIPALHLEGRTETEIREVPPATFELTETIRMTPHAAVIKGLYPHMKQFCSRTPQCGNSANLE